MTAIRLGPRPHHWLGKGWHVVTEDVIDLQVAPAGKLQGWFFEMFVAIQHPDVSGTGLNVVSLLAFGLCAFEFLPDDFRELRLKYQCRSHTHKARNVQMRWSG